jgi:hypothetical protein
MGANDAALSSPEKYWRECQKKHNGTLTFEHLGKEGIH